jgi:hypothetical protein
MRGYCLPQETIQIIIVSLPTIFKKRSEEPLYALQAVPSFNNPCHQRFQGFFTNLKKMLDKFERAVIIVSVFSLLN